MKLAENSPVYYLMKRCMANGFFKGVFKGSPDGNTVDGINTSHVEGKKLIYPVGKCLFSISPSRC